MRKPVFFLIALLTFCLCLSFAGADTEYSLSPCPGTVQIPDNYIVLTPDNLGSHPDLLASLGFSSEELLADWEDRGVIMQAWLQNKKHDTCIEISVRQDSDSQMYHDLVNHREDSGWSSFISSHKGTSAYTEEGYTFYGVEKKQLKNSNYFLFIKKYKRVIEGKTYWGGMFKTVARGYTVVLDYQVYDRGLRSNGGEVNYLRNIANTVRFGEDGSASGSGSSAPSSAYLQITSAPPENTNTGEFTIEGTTVPGAHLIGVLMRVNSVEPLRFYADAHARTGRFKMKVSLTEANVWLMTLNVEVDGQTVTDYVFPTINYSETLLPVTFDSGIPDVLTADETVISGITDKSVTVQCIVTNGTNTFEKQIRTNGTGKFSFKVPTALEAEYHFTLVFSKKGLETQRFTGTASRNLSDEDKKAAIRRDAIKPGYSTLCKKMDGYIGRIMGYTLYVTDVRQAGNEWLIYTAMTRTKGGTYKNPMIFTTSEDPGLETGVQRLFYGTCIGFHTSVSEDGTEERTPAFDLLFIAE